jgi:hypothetical protein
MKDYLTKDRKLLMNSEKTSKHAPASEVALLGSNNDEYMVSPTTDSFGDDATTSLSMDTCSSDVSKCCTMLSEERATIEMTPKTTGLPISEDEDQAESHEIANLIQRRLSKFHRRKKSSKQKTSNADVPSAEQKSWSDIGSLF